MLKNDSCGAWHAFVHDHVSPDRHTERGERIIYMTGLILSLVMALAFLALVVVVIMPPPPALAEPPSSSISSDDNGGPTS